MPGPAYQALESLATWSSTAAAGLRSEIRNRFAQNFLSLRLRCPGASLADRHAGSRRLCAEQGRRLFALFRRRGRAPQDSRDARDARLHCRRAATDMAPGRQHTREATDAAMDGCGRMNDSSELLPAAFPSEAGDGGPGTATGSHIALSCKAPVVPWEGSP